MTDTVTHELNMALAQAIHAVIPDAAISLVRNMDGDERVIFIEEDRPWVVTVDPLALP